MTSRNLLAIAQQKQLLANDPQFPIDIFAFNDEMAIGVYKYVRETDFRIGKEIRIIGFDNTELGALCSRASDDLLFETSMGHGGS